MEGKVKITVKAVNKKQTNPKIHPKKERRKLPLSHFVFVIPSSEACMHLHSHINHIMKIH